VKHKIKLILKSVRQYKKAALITPIFMIGEVLMECLLPFLTSALMESVQDAVELNQIHGFSDIFKTITYTHENFGWQIPVSVFGIIITLVLMVLISLTCGILGGRFAATASVGMATNLRNDLYAKIQTFSFSNIDKFSSSSLITRLTTDVSNVQMAFQMCIRIVVRAPLMMIFSAIMAFITGGLMALIFVVLIPLVAVGLFFIVKKAMGIFIRVFKKYDRLNESVEENVSAIRVVKSFVREDFEKEKFNKASDAMTNDFIRAEKTVALNGPLMNTAIHVSNILIVGLGTLFCFQTSQGTDTLIHFEYVQISPLLTYGIQILMSVNMISMIMVMLVMSIECIKRIGEILEEEPTIANPENPIYEVENGDIEFDNVDFKYSLSAEKNTLENLNLKIKSGQFIGVLGATGSGKTSLVNLISRLYDVTDGSVKVAGHDVREYDLDTLRNEVAVVLQKNVLFSGTIASNLRWGKEDATVEEMLKAMKIAQASELAKDAESLERKVEQGGTNFSGGQKQRLCIARAILKNPKILILDDSTSAVDTKTDKLIRSALKNDLKEMTKIVIAQRISSIEEADQIIVMNDGRIEQIGTHDELLKTNSIYQEVYNTQNRVGGNK
jgi:ATP-binding cassette subfamily B protein